MVTFDNLIYMYKESYESKGGVSIKSYENISPQLYANYLMSIYKMIPEHYISNNLSQLCREIDDEFTQKLQLSKDRIIFIIFFKNKSKFMKCLLKYTLNFKSRGKN